MLVGYRAWEGRRDTSDRLPCFQSCLPHFAQTEFSVVRQHEEFIWLHDAYVENEEYAGLIVRKGWAGWGREGPGRLGGVEDWVTLLGVGDALLSNEGLASSVPPLSRSLQPLQGQTLRLQGKSCRSWVRGTAPSRGKSLPK